MTTEDAETFDRETRRHARGDTGGAPPVRELSTIWADDIEISLDDGGVVDGLLPLQGLTVLYGESGAGKTFTALDLACHVAAGMPWRGMEVEQGVVVYVAAEAPSSVKRRIWAWRQHHQVERLPVLVVQSSVDLLNGDADALVALVAQVARGRGRVVMVVLDTLARAMTGNENAPDDMGKFVAACGAIREAGDTHVLVVHHSGKDTAKGARGHSSLRAATDVELEVTAGCIKVTKSRDDEGGRTFGFRLEVVELGTNAKGRTITTCVAVAAEAPARPEKNKTKLTDKQDGALQALRRAIADHGEVAPSGPPNIRSVDSEAWLETAIRFMPSMTDPKLERWRKRARLLELAEALRKHGVIRYEIGRAHV